MKLFSQRQGLEPVKDALQVDSMDDALRNSLWNVFKIVFWDSPNTRPPEILVFFRILWFRFYKEPLDFMPVDLSNACKVVRKLFFNYEWNKVYDFVEFCANDHPDSTVREEYIRTCNVILEREMSAYRFVGGILTQLTSEEEIAEVEQALADSSPTTGVKYHLKTALAFLSNRKSPDYRNSIKESISAVESLCKLFAKSDNAKLSDVLKKMETKAALHPALKKAFTSLYGYTSDADGIRHALLDEPNLDFEDAKFMLVACSAFVNYLIAKAEKVGIAI